MAFSKEFTKRRQRYIEKPMFSLRKLFRRCCLASESNQYRDYISHRGIEVKF
jgi:hypothetical protein